MQRHRPVTPRRRGSALMTVVFFTAIMAMLTASLLTYTATEARGNERNRMILRAKNAAENIAIYAAEQLTTKLYRMGSTPVMSFPWTGSSKNRIYPPPDHVLTSEYMTPTSGMQMRCGIESATPYTLVTDQSSPNFGLQVSTAKVPIIAKATVNHPSMGDISAYVQQDMEIALTPLFQFGMFYNMDMEFYPSQAFTVTGPAHTNGHLIAHPDGSSTIAITFRNRTTAAGGLYWNTSMKAKTRGANGNESLAVEANGDVIFFHTNGTTNVTLKESSKWRDHRYKTTAETTSTLNQFKTFATNTYNGNLRTSVHGVTKLELPGIGTYRETDDPSTPDVDERSNGRQIIEGPNPRKWDAATSTWVATTDTSAERESKISTKAGLFIVVNPDDDATPRTATLPDDSVVYILPRSYRAWLNITETDGTHTMTEIILPGQPSYGYNRGADGIAGNSDDYMYVNNLPNYHTTSSIGGIGTGNQVLRIPQQDVARVRRWNGAAWVAPAAGDAPPTGINGAGYATTGSSTNGTTFPADNLGTPGTDGINYTPHDAYFYDIRRANGNRGVISVSGTGARYDRFTVNYVPRIIAKIDFDMTRLKMMVDRTVNSATTSLVYDVRAPNVAGVTFANSIYNTAGTRTNLGLGLGASFNTFPTGGTPTAQDPFNVYYAPTDPEGATTISNIATDPRLYLVPAAKFNSATDPCAWYDGVAIFLHSVDAEMRAQTAGVANRIDSGVRLWNGRGPIVSLSTSGKTGCTFVTNDAVYIVGHYNADGNINATATATGNGGYSARWPDSNEEKLCAVMGDAFMPLSQPTWSSSSSGQVNGWNDALSALPVVLSSANWRTGSSATAALNGNDDGVLITTASNGPNAGLLPNNNTPGPFGTGLNIKLTPPTTHGEISTALVMGIIPSNHNPTGLTDLGHAPPGAAAGTYLGNGVNSGGANNFPRLCESWSSRSLYIRGSIVGLFESRVAMEPFTNSRNYRAAGRFWGLHENFSTANHDVPLEPIVLSSTRVGFRELSATDYATKKAAIEAL